MDTLGLSPIPFLQHRFELIASDVKDRSAHKISLLYLTDSITLYAIIGDQLLLGLEPPQTFLLKMQPGLSVISYIESCPPHPSKTSL
jgi:hypothetical protein